MKTKLIFIKDRQSIDDTIVFELDEVFIARCENRIYGTRFDFPKLVYYIRDELGLDRMDSKKYPNVNMYDIHTHYINENECGVVLLVFQQEYNSVFRKMKIDKLLLEL